MRPIGDAARSGREEIDRHARALVEQFDIRTPSVDTRAGTLSGGNIQKLVLARELTGEAKVVVFHKPTYGLDLKTTRTVRGLINGLRDGRAALLISTDLDELLECADRIAVLSRGRIVGTVPERAGRRRTGRSPDGRRRESGLGGRMTEEVAPAHPTDVVEPAPPALGGSAFGARYALATRGGVP